MLFSFHFINKFFQIHVVFYLFHSQIHIALCWFLERLMPWRLPAALLLEGKFMFVSVYSWNVATCRVRGPDLCPHTPPWEGQDKVYVEDIFSVIFNSFYKMLLLSMNWIQIHTSYDNAKLFYLCWYLDVGPTWFASVHWGPAWGPWSRSSVPVSVPARPARHISL